jgi:hypothetical protein
MMIVAQAWGGESPEFASQEEAEELVQTFGGGLLEPPVAASEHSTPLAPAALRSEARQARWQELGGFVDGLFGDEEDMDVPEKVSPS